MSQEKLKPFACDILLSAGISIMDTCFIFPSSLNGPTSNCSRNAILLCTLGRREDQWEMMPPATAQWPGKSSLFPLPL